MTFLNPLVLIGLAAAAIPLILHLLSLRKPRTIEFSSLAFLKELQRTSIRRLQLRQILLLIVRTALIIFIILAFSRPVIRGSVLGTVGTHAHTSAVLLLDDSFSMSAADERGQLFRQAKDVARQIVSLLKEGDEVFLVRMSDLRDPALPVPTHDFNHVSTSIAETRISSIAGSLEDGLRISARILARARNSNKEVYIVSDLQRTLASDHGQESAAGGKILLEGTKVFIFSVGTREVDNVSVDSVAIRSQIFDRGKPVGIMARVRNWGKSPLQGYLASVYLGGSRVAQQNVDVPPWGSGILNFTVIPKRSGAQHGSVSLEEDAVDQDNRRVFTFTIPVNINLLFVAASQEDIRFLSLALTAGTDEQGKGLFKISQIVPSQFPTADLRVTDVIVFSNVPSFSLNDATRVKSFVQQGGGVILFPGSATVEANYSSTLFSALDIPPLERRDADTGSGRVLAFHHVDMDHPLFTGMFETGGLRTESAIESPEIHRAVRQRPGRQGRTVITMGDESPFLTEHRAGNGMTLIFSSAPVLTWTDFPLKGIFAPLIHRSVLYAAAQADQIPSYTVGDEPVFKLARTLSRSGLNSTAMLRSPEGTEELLRPIARPGDGSTRLSLGRLLEPGFYKLFVGRSDSVLIPVNVPPRESDLRKMSDGDLAKLLASFGVGDPIVVRTPENIQATVLQSRYGVELWKACILAAIVCALLEMVIARESATKEKNFVFEHEQTAKRNHAA